MSRETTIKKREVGQMLRQAFAEVPCADLLKNQRACGPFSHADWLVLREDLFNYEPEVIQYLLPSILQDAMNSRTGDGLETDDIEKLVLQLNPLWLDNELVRENQLRQFANFTAEQAQAVCEWLRLVHSWEEMKRFADWVDSAIAYWCGRASERTS